jgi:hypothetical protein
MREENLLGAFPLLLSGRDLVRLQFPLPEVRNGVDYNPRYAPTKVHNLQRSRQNEEIELGKDGLTHLMQQETHQARSDDGVPNPYIPRSPVLFEPVELAEVSTGVELLSRVL